jgi:hypothetical protein
MNHKEVLCVDGWICLAQNRFQCRAFVNVMKKYRRGTVEVEEFIDSLRGY